MNIELERGLAFVSVTLTHRGKTLRLERVLLDTGSAATAFKIDKVEAVGLIAESNDKVERVRGVGGVEFMLRKRVDKIELENLRIARFEVQLGALEYGLEMNGILGLDFLLVTKATLKFGEMSIE